VAKKQFEIALSRIAIDNIAALRRYDQQRVAAAIDNQLLHEPLHETKSRKQLHIEEGVLAFEYVSPLWEVRVGSFRIYYDVDEAAGVVNVRAVRRKPAHRTTEESFYENHDD
jgi:mRNA-degrading endonuclease RelE of RelBE toxin-antitoxin system